MHNQLNVTYALQCSNVWHFAIVIVLYWYVRVTHDSVASL
jgi:hypothetical protein